MKTFHTFLAYFVLQATFSLSAVVFEIQDLQHDDQHVICFKSGHGEKFPEIIGVRQASEMLEAAQKYDAVVMAEDIFTYDGEHKKIADALNNHNRNMTDHIYACKNMLEKIKPYILPADYFLRQLISNCRKFGITHTNVECRYPYHAIENGLDIPREYVIKYLKDTRLILEADFQEIERHIQSDFRAEAFFNYYKKIKKELDQVEPAFLII